MILKAKYLPNAYKFTYLLIFLIAIIKLSIGELATVENVDDGKLVQLINKRDNVVVLFTKDKCGQCEDLEMIVNNINKELQQNLNAAVVKIFNSNMVNLYSPNREPALVFFRHGVPLLYYGHYNEASIVQRFLENQEPVSKELSDENFEHLTQAATGATTGDWFVFFYSTDCVKCLRLFAVWEAVAAELKHRVNVARIDRIGTGNFTAKRFNVIQSPHFIFFRQGKMYRYNNKDITPWKLIDFGLGTYKKQAQPEIVPPEATLLSRFLTNQYEWLANNKQLVVIVTVFASIVMLILIRRTSKKSTEKDKATELNKKAK